MTMTSESSTRAHVRPHPSQERLRDLLAYDPETGIWKWTGAARGYARYAGKVAGCLNAEGYWQISIGAKLYLAHRLAFLYMDGEWPSEDVDHADMDRANNKWNNLRQATRSQNVANKPAQSNSLSGIRGVRETPHGTWQAYACHDGKYRSLGNFASKDAAAAAARKSLIARYGEFARV